MRIGITFLFSFFVLCNVNVFCSISSGHDIIVSEALSEHRIYIKAWLNKVKRAKNDDDRQKLVALAADYLGISYDQVLMLLHENQSYISDHSSYAKKQKSGTSITSMVAQGLVLGAIAVGGYCLWDQTRTYPREIQCPDLSTLLEKAYKGKNAKMASIAACALFAAALGDALARDTERVRTREITSCMFQGKKPSRLADATSRRVYPRKDICPYTDDTVMSLVVFQAMANASGNDDRAVALMAEGFADLFEEKTKEVIDPWHYKRGHGRTVTKNSLRISALIKNTTIWNNFLYGDLSTASTEDKCEIKKELACGSVMRAWPIGLFYKLDQLDRAIRVADAQSRLTHRHPLARAACAAAAAGMVAIHDDTEATVDNRISKVVSTMINTAKGYEEEERLYESKKSYPILENKLSMPSITKWVEDCKQMIADDSMTTSDMIFYAATAGELNIASDIVLGTINDRVFEKNLRSASGALLGWPADEALAAAVYLFVRYKDDIETALQEARLAPGDSDSIASLTGALCGAFMGDIEKVFYFDAKDNDQTSHNIDLIENSQYFKALANVAADLGRK